MVHTSLNGRVPLSKSKPELNINNEDVICTHGCTIGTLDENHLFYLQHRGLTYE